MEGFTMFKDTYAAIPCGKKGYVIIHNGYQLEKLCRTEASARKYITDHKKGVSMGKLPI
jgi:hydrogenase maturation factor